MRLGRSHHWAHTRWQSSARRTRVVPLEIAGTILRRLTSSGPSETPFRALRPTPKSVSPARPPKISTWLPTPLGKYNTQTPCPFPPPRPTNPTMTSAVIAGARLAFLIIIGMRWIGGGRGWRLWGWMPRFCWPSHRKNRLRTDRRIRPDRPFGPGRVWRFSRGR